jgi:hypothetical protein
MKIYQEDKEAVLEKLKQGRIQLVLMVRTMPSSGILLLPICILLDETDSCLAE